MAAINLDKKKEQVAIVLTKRNIPNVKAAVKFAADVSGSMSNLYRYGNTMEDVIARFFAISLLIDDDGAMQSHIFDDGQKQLTDITAENIDGYVNKVIIPNAEWGGTAYSPVMKAMVDNGKPIDGAQLASSVLGGMKKLFGFGSKKPEVQVVSPTPSADTVPTLAFIFTDGDNFDPKETFDLITKYHDQPIYWKFIGIGNAKYEFVQKVADQFSNVGFTRIEDITGTSDQDMYFQVFDEELSGWLLPYSK